VKGGLRQSALTAMKLSFTGEKTLSKEPLGQLQSASLNKFMGLSDQNVLDHLGIIQKNEVLGADLEMNDVTVIAGQLSKKAQRVPA
jgi:hypothetical protein